MNRVEESIRRHWGHAPVNIEQVIIDCGIELDTNANLDPTISGQLRKLDHGGFEISVNAKDHVLRKRFSMAHELGHYYLHRSLVGKGTDDDRMYRTSASGLFYNTDIKKKHEHEANSFAAYVLMPEPLINSLLKSETRPPFSSKKFFLSEKLQVSAAAMALRLKALHISPDF